MSGTSVDGLDVAHCQFNDIANHIEYSINHAHTFQYDEALKQRLRNAEHLSALDFIRLDRDLGIIWGKWINQFISHNNINNINAIASHGHTIFHQPKDGITTQIGSVSHIKAITNLPIIYDFRSLDVALGGNGAPLVPIGDQILFGEYIACVNIGGFANISYAENQQHGMKRIAYDITPTNIVLNHYAQQLGSDYDHNGNYAKQGTIHQPLLDTLLNHPYYHTPAPKSLGKEDVVSTFLPIIDSFNITPADKLATATEAFATQIAKAANQIPTQGKILFTGGGCYNTFMMEKIKKELHHQLIIPNSQTIDYKEALIFALLGMLKLTNSTNCLSSVTGSTHDHCGGAIM